MYPSPPPKKSSRLQKGMEKGLISCTRGGKKVLILRLMFAVCAPG